MGITGISGGSGGLEAAYDAVRALADAYDAAGNELRGWAGLGVRTMANPDLAESAPLSPLTFAEAESAVLAATTGPDGVLVASCGWEADAVLVRAVLAAFETTDRMVAAAVDTVDRMVGHAVGFTLGVTAPALLPAIGLARPAGHLGLHTRHRVGRRSARGPVRRRRRGRRAPQPALRARRHHPANRCG